MMSNCYWAVLRGGWIYRIKKGKVLRIASRNKKSYFSILRKDYIGQPEFQWGRTWQMGSEGRDNKLADCGVVCILVTTEVR